MVAAARGSQPNLGVTSSILKSRSSPGFLMVIFLLDPGDCLLTISRFLLYEIVLRVGIRSFSRRFLLYLLWLRFSQLVRGGSGSSRGFTVAPLFREVSLWTTGDFFFPVGLRVGWSFHSGSVAFLCLVASPVLWGCRFGSGSGGGLAVAIPSR